MFDEQKPTNFFGLSILCLVLSPKFNRMSICQQFNLLCDKYPYITQGIVSGLLQVTGDVLVQKCINESERISAKRCYNFMLTGLVSGCIYRKWYGVLDNNFHDPRPAINAFGRAAGVTASNTRLLRIINFFRSSWQLVWLPSSRWHDHNHRIASSWRKLHFVTRLTHSHATGLDNLDYLEIPELLLHAAALPGHREHNARSRLQPPLQHD